MAITEQPVQNKHEAELASESGAGGARALIGLLLGVGLCGLMLAVPPPEGLELRAWRTAAVGILMAVWWVTEPIPIPATALLPLALFPLLGVADIEATSAPYANSVIYLFLGGFFIAEAMHRWQLHRRIALLVILAVGTEPVRLIGGFMLASGFISLWVSNTATAVMMMPIGISVVQRALATEAGAQRDQGTLNFATALLLGIAYASNIGGLGTPIGTPPNALLVGYMRDAHGVEVGFGQWMLVGLPIVAIGLPLGWLLLAKVFPTTLTEIPGGEEAIRLELQSLGRWTPGELRVCAVFAFAAVSWTFRPLIDDWVPGLSDTGIAIIAALALFLLPVDRARGVYVLEWEQAKKVPWEVLLLFGGGLSLAAAISHTGLAEWMGTAMEGLRVMPLIAIIMAVAVTVIFLTEFTSNTATAAAFLPVLGSLAIGVGHDPILLAVPAAMAASCGFMMPVGTPPNAIVYATGMVTMRQMLRVGFYLNALFAVLITVISFLLLRAAFGI